jgi:hypothetical protein
MFLAVQVGLVVAGLFILFRGKYEICGRVIANPIASLVGLVLTAQFPIALVLWFALWLSEPAPTPVAVPTRAGDPVATVAVPEMKAVVDQFWWVDPFIACGSVIIAAALTAVALRNENASDEVFESLAVMPPPEADAAH